MTVQTVLPRDRGGRYTRLLDAWAAPPDAGRPIACLATSFTFDPVFFEEECVGRFLRLDTNPNEDGVAYLIEREEKLAGTRVVALVDHRHANPMRSLRWDLLPVRVPGAAQHSKVSLLAWERTVRLIVASANLTEPGYRSNLEIFASLDFHDGGSVPLDVLSEVLSFLRGIVNRYTPGVRNEPGAKQRALRLLGRVGALASGFEPSRSRSRLHVQPLFAGVVNGARHDVFGWLKEEALRLGRPQTAVVVSPFYDENRTGTMEAIQEVMLQHGDRRVDFVTDGKPIEDDRVQLHVPEWLTTENPARLKVGLHRLLPEDDEDVRPLHAKMLFFERAREYSIAVVGSSNFTRAGLGLGGGPINLEANVAYLLRHKPGSERELFSILPPTEGPFEPEDVVFDSKSDPELDEVLVPILPGGFREALFQPSSSGGELILRFGDSLPHRWKVLAPEGDHILDAEELAKKDDRLEVRSGWERDRPPSYVVVRWADERREGDPISSTGEKEARWVVNVTDPSLLPPPEELRALPLETLLLILTSARPVHQTLARELRRKEATTTSGLDPHLDPLRRFQDETHLLYRTRKVARALEQLRLRLERPVLLEDALKWRLEGPVGPVALARALVREARSPAEGTFLVAEVILTVSSVQFATNGASIPRKKIRRCVKQCINALREEIDLSALAEKYPRMSEYVEQVLRRAGL